MQEQKNQLQVGHVFTEDQLITSLFDFFTGGSGTMSKTLSFCILFMLHHPESQEKLRKDSEKFAYTQAFIYEVQRLASVLPISPPRMVTSDIEVGGYKLYKGQQVQMNLYAMHRNQKHWGDDAETFRPERFLDDQGNVITDEWLQPFGYGKTKNLRFFEKGQKMPKMTQISKNVLFNHVRKLQYKSLM